MVNRSALIGCLTDMRRSLERGPKNKSAREKGARRQRFLFVRSCRFQGKTNGSEK